MKIVVIYLANVAKLASVTCGQPQGEHGIEECGLSLAYLRSLRAQIQLDDKLMIGKENERRVCVDVLRGQQHFHEEKHRACSRERNVGGRLWMVVISVVILTCIRWWGGDFPG